MAAKKRNLKKNLEEKSVLLPEILAPAGSMEAVKAAVLAGADAVYVGGSAFGARAFADNLDKDALLAAIAYVHRQKKRIYLTVNTLVKEQEFAALYEFLAPFYAAGLDAVIVQDVGVVRFLAKHFPSLPIHASTQMTLTCANGAEIFSGYPVTRIVPARELSLKEIKGLCEKSRLEVEIFVHGAYCYCYSGQCLMSSVIGGRSGNRGRCAQPCRMEYKTENGAAGYFLSPKDLCGLSLLPELIETGAASFKIEGRMKRPEYVAAVTAAYKEGVEAYFRLGKEGYTRLLNENPDFLENKITEMADVYNRGGFTTGCFLRKNGPELLSVRRPGHFGVEVGRVVTDSAGTAEFVLTRAVSMQDVLELRRSSGAREGVPAYYEFTLGTGARAGERLTMRMLPGLKAKKGDFVYRMKNAALLEKINERYIREKKTAVEGIFTAKAGEVCTLTLRVGAIERLTPQKECGSEEGEDLFTQTKAGKWDLWLQREKIVPVVVCVDGFLCEKAGKLPATEESVKKQLCKTGNEEFFFESLLVALADDVFLPNGKLNELRRTAFARLEEEMQERFWRTDALPWSGTEPGGDGTGRQGEEAAVQAARTFPVDCVVLTKEQAAAAGAAAGVRRIYADFCEYPEQEMLAGLEKLKDSKKELFFVLPRVCRRNTQERLKKELLQVLPLVDGFLIRNYESLSLFREFFEREAKGKRFVLDANLYVMNKSAKGFYREYFKEEPYELTAPYELSARELEALDISDMTLVVYGRIPLMVSTHCVRKNTEKDGKRTAAAETGLEKYGKRKTAGCMRGEEKQLLHLTDRVGKRLPIQCFCKDCYNVIYNPETLNLTGEEKAMERLRPRALRLDFTTEDAQEAGRILEAVVRGLPVKAGTTRGHFRKGAE